MFRKGKTWKNLIDYFVGIGIEGDFLKILILLIL